MVSNPKATLTAIGKNANAKAVTIAGIAFAPNQTASSGTHADLGIVLNATSNG
jgi:hypothetical protein